MAMEQFSNPSPEFHSQSQASSLPPAAIALAERLFNAARTGDTALLTAALDHNPGIRNLTNSKGDTILMLASYHGHLELTKVLLEKYKADPNVLNARGQSPLAGSVFKNEAEILKLLLANGAHPDLGTPSAEECLSVFSLEDAYGKLFEEARRGLKAENEVYST